MYILCDTCSILMLLRIAPDMFADKRYECVTIRQVWEEITQTQKFKSKYPWRKDYARHIQSLPKSTVETADYQLTLRAVYFHRNNLRRKLGLQSAKDNLESFLNTLI